MGIQKQEQDPEYLRAKHAFTRDLLQFHESRGTGYTQKPNINGKEVDLYLLYQIVTSHGGGEKINYRNEWDNLLQYFNLPRSTNGGLAIKSIYSRFLEVYEKIHYHGEHVDAKDEADDEYDTDFRGRRRYPNKFTSSHHHHHHSSSLHTREITDHNRSQLGLSSRILESSDYGGLLLSLQSPLPNEQDMALSVCTLLSNETKHVLRFSKSPAILNMLLAHAGIYKDCGIRLLMEETYKGTRGMDHAEFWDEVLHHRDSRQLLCECFPKRMSVSLGLTEDEGAIISQLREIEIGDLPEEEKFSIGIALRLRLRRIQQLNKDEAETSSTSFIEDVPLTSTEEETETSTNPPPDTPVTTTKEPHRTESIETVDLQTNLNPDEITSEDTKNNNDSSNCNSNHIESSSNSNDNEMEVLPSSSSSPVKVNGNSNKLDDSESSIVLEEGDVPQVKEEDSPSFCCSYCPCQRQEETFPLDDNDNVSSDDFSIHRTFSKAKGQVTVDEGEEDGPSSTLPISLKRTQNSGDKVGQRISQIAHILRNLSFEQDNAFIMSRNPTLMRFLLVAANCKFSSLAQTAYDIIGNISSHIQLEEPLQDPLSSMFLTLVTSSVFSSDRFKILRSLEAIRELSKVEGNESILTRYIESSVYKRMCDLLTLSDIMLLIYTLECILSITELGEVVCDEIVMVKGSVATLVSLVTVEAQSYGPKGCILMRVVETVTGGNTTNATSSQPSSSAPSPALPSSSQSTTSHQPTPPPPTAATPISLSAVPPTQHLLQQQLQQPPNPIYSPANTPGRPSPASSPNPKVVTGTTIVPPVIQGQIAQHHQQQTIKSSSLSIQNVIPANSVQNSSMFTTSNPTQTNHVNSLSTTIQSPYPPKQSALPSISDNSVIKVNNQVSTPVFTSHGLPAGATTVVIQKSTANATQAATVNGIPSMVATNLPQISNQSLSQHHVVTPNISIVTPRGTLTEEAWAIAWLKGTFESSTGTSIEQGEIYRMYSAARKNPNVVLSLEQFVQCVKCAYGASVGPVIKQFGGGTSLPFFEGIKPKIAIRAVGVTPASAVQLQAAALKAMGSSGAATAVIAAVTTSTSSLSSQQQLLVPSGAPTPTMITTPQLLQTPTPPTTVMHPTPTTTSASSAIITQAEMETVVTVEATNLNNNNDIGNTVDGTTTHPVSVHIPSRDSKPSLSPILQATLSLPPKAKGNTGNCPNNAATATSPSSQLTRSKNQKMKKEKVSRKKEHGKATNNVAMFGGPTSTKKNNSGGFSPTSCAIRSLLASKVAQRQQSKLHQQHPKTSVNETGHNSVSKEDAITNYSSSEVVKVNGVGPDGCLDKIEESSSSLLSSDGSENSGANKASVPITSFHGVLLNGQANLDEKNEILEVTSELDCGGKNRNLKGMLIDLLERRVPSREPVNGVVAGREIRISEKGLELIENMEEVTLAAGTSAPETLLNHNNSTCPTSEVEESQKMTFYSSTSDAQVTLQGQAPSAACVIPTTGAAQSLSDSGVTIASGGGSSMPSANSTSALRPQQLTGIKRSLSPAPTSGTSAVVPGNNNNNRTGDEPPPAKRQALDSTASKEEDANSVETNTVLLPQEGTTAPNCSLSIQTNSNSSSTTSSAIATTAATPTTTHTLPAGAGAQVVQLPLRLSVNPQNPQQLTFTRQLVLPSGQQLLFSNNNSQQQLQGQVIISKPQGSATDQIPKAIIILQPQHQKQQGQSVTNAQNPSTTVTTQHQLHSTIAVATTAATSHPTVAVANNLTQVPVSTTQVIRQHVSSRPQQIVGMQQHPQLMQQVQGVISSTNSTPQITKVVGATSHQLMHPGNLSTIPSTMIVPQQAPQAILHGVAHKPLHRGQFEGVRASSYPHLTPEQLELEFPYLCEWRGCELRFLKPQQVSMHALKVHCPETLVDEVKCQWGKNGCDPLLRKRFSLMTHLQDRHCSKQALDMSLYRRQNQIEPPPVPQQPLHHPGYAPNAAFHAIKRHAMTFMATKEHLHDDNEGPVTKSIRLTAALILRNLVNYSSLGRRMLRGYESHLSLIAMSNVESSRTIAQLLHDMSEPPKTFK